MQAVPWWAGALIVLIALAYSFGGWRMIRAGAAISVGVWSAVLAMMLVSRAWGVWPGAAAAALAGVLGALIGFWWYHIQMGLAGGVLLSTAAFCLAYAVVGGPEVAGPWPGRIILGAAAAGGGIGFVLFWKLAPLIGSVVTALLGGALAAVGTAVLLQNQGPGLLIAAPVVVGTLTAAAGVVFQLKRLARDKARTVEPDEMRRDAAGG